MDTAKYQAKLEEEKAHLTEELEAIADRRPGVPGDWQARPEEANTDTRDDVAEKFETLEQRRANEHTLESRLNEVAGALERIAKGTFGFCEVGNEPIEADRLEANPAARTCKAHLEDLNGNR
jgi:RNA polymerase-binding transcription factor DksA